MFIWELGKGAHTGSVHVLQLITIQSEPTSHAQVSSQHPGVYPGGTVLPEAALQQSTVIHVLPRSHTIRDKVHLRQRGVKEIQST